MSRKPDSNDVSGMKNRGEAGVHGASGWTTDTELVREFDQPVSIVDAVSSTVDEAIRRWPELSETPSLYQFVEVENLDGLFKTEPADGSGWLPSTKFRFQSCRVTLLYGSPIRVIVERDP